MTCEKSFELQLLKKKKTLSVNYCHIICSYNTKSNFLHEYHVDYNADNINTLEEILHLVITELHAIVRSLFMLKIHFKNRLTAMHHRLKIENNPN